MNKINHIAIVGLGAIGSSLGSQISTWAPTVKLYGLVENIDAYWGSPILIENTPLQINYRTLDTLIGIPLDLILICVRSYQLKDTINQIAPLVGPETRIISFVGGISSEKFLIRAFGEKHTIFSVLRGTSIRRNGRYVSTPVFGKLFLGSSCSDSQPFLSFIQNFFTQCHIQTISTDEIEREMWRQLLVDIGYEQTATVLQLSKNSFFQNNHALNTLHTTWHELLSLAAKLNVPLKNSDLSEVEYALRLLPDNSHASMLQDFWANRRLETDIFCDEICALGDTQKIPMPANHWLRNELHSMVKKRGTLSFEDTEPKGLNLRHGYTTTPEKIANQLRLDIMKAHFAPKQKIAETDLASRFQASRSSVRTALQLLQSEGLLTTLPNGRKEVSPFSEKQLQNLFSLRSLLENYALTLLFEQNETVYPLLAGALDKIEQKYHSSSLHLEIADLDILFHKSLVLSADNLFLSNAWLGISQLLYASMIFKRSLGIDSHSAVEFFEKHKHIYSLILSKDKAIFPELKRHIDEEKEEAVFIIGSFHSEDLS